MLATNSISFSKFRSNLLGHESMLSLEMLFVIINLNIGQFINPSFIAISIKY
uniref:Uncharacterized protein n=1 Tax=Arundo donax TaxID=35708 RepID=A0A0A8ZWB2_ARUDO